MKTYTAAILVVFAQIGLIRGGSSLGEPCSFDTDCGVNQICNGGVCQCDTGFVNNGGYCASGFTESWPRGKWGLLRAGKACPKHATFRKGKSYQDTEDSSNKNSWTANSFDKFPGKMKSDGIELHYCSKTNWDQGQGDWPTGDYCIHRVGRSCPTGFTQGSVKWDDENTFNMNSKKGFLPAGQFGKDTQVHFCCRSDGNYSDKIALPVSRPFFLYPYTSSNCQSVRHMTSTLLFIAMDEENVSNQNERTGSFPFMGVGNSTDHILLYCHYAYNTFTS